MLFFFSLVVAVEAEEIRLFSPQSHVSNAIKEFVANSVDPLAKIKVVVYPLRFRETNAPEIQARYEVGPLGKKYELDGEKVSEESYFNKIEQDSLVFWPSSFFAELNSYEVKKILDEGEPVYITEFVEPKPQTLYSYIFSLSSLTSYAHNNGYKGDQIGVYFTETGCPDRSELNISLYQQGDTCTNGVQTHSTKVALTLQKTAPLAKIYGYDQHNHPNPNIQTPRIEIGSHSWAQCYNTNLYCGDDLGMDNYIYNNRIIIFAAAGNKNQSISNYWVSSPGKAVNAITVGAVHPVNDEITDYSMWKNSDVMNQKPEVLNYTDFQFPGYSTVSGVFEGTSASTPYTAGIMADVLQQHPFFKRHPELAKALLITASTHNVGNPSLDGDNYTQAGKAVPLYLNLGWNTRSAYWNGANSCCFNSSNEISFTESGIQIKILT